MSATNQRGIVSAFLESKHATTLERFLTEKREQNASHETIARDLHVLTNGTVSVSGETIRRWINDLEAVA
jgi:hypothetical protein